MTHTHPDPLPLSSETTRAYASAWLSFASWCEENGLTALPADPQTVARYVGDHREARAYSTLRKWLRAIDVVHEAGGHAPPSEHALVAEAWAQVRTDVVRREAEAPLSPAPVEGPVDIRGAVHPDVLQMVDAQPGTLIGLRDGALLLVGAVCRMSRAELVGLRAEDVNGLERKGPTIIRIDYAGAERVVEVHDASGLPSLKDTIREWIMKSGIEDGPLFRAVDRWGNVQPGPLTRQALSGVMKRAAELAGLPASSASTALFMEP